MIDLTIFFDVDGVLINWLTPFHMFLREHGHAALGATEHRYPTLSAAGLRAHTLAFNESRAFRELQVSATTQAALWRLRHALPRVAFHYVSACGTLNTIQEARRAQLKGLPDGDRVTCLKLGATKRHIFASAVRAMVVEDSPDHLRVAQALGHVTVRVHQSWNEGCEAGRVGVRSVTEITPELVKAMQERWV